MRVLFYLEQPAFTKSRAPAGRVSKYRRNTVLCHFAGTVWGRQGAALRRSGSPHKRPVTCGHRPASPDACGRDFRCAIAPLKCGRNLRFPHKRPLPLYTHDDLQRAAPRMSRRFGKNYLTKSDKFTVRSLIHSFSFTTWW